MVLLYAKAMGELLGITGAIGSGKTTFATLLTKVESSHAIYETSQLVAEIADAFNQALKAELSFETAQNNIDVVNQVLIWLPEAISEHLRYDLVWNQLAITKHQTLAQPALYDRLFVYLTRVRTTPKLLRRTITTKNKSDYRDLLQWLGGYLVAKISKTIWYDEIVRRIDEHSAGEKLVIVTGLRYPSDADTIANHGGRIVAITRPGHEHKSNDVTEIERSNITPDITIVNNGTLEDLRLVAARLWADLGAQKITQHYHAAQAS